MGQKNEKRICPGMCISFCKITPCRVKCCFASSKSDTSKAGAFGRIDLIFSTNLKLNMSSLVPVSTIGNQWFRFDHFGETNDESFIQTGNRTRSLRA
jgi:hypothetical protein